jgi:drug/metabolite transporter (DMT)-like permease
VHWVAFFQAIQVSNVAVGLLTFATFPVFAAVLEPLLPGEHFDRRTLAAAVVTLVGIALVVPTPDLADPIVQGALWGVFSGLTFALLSLANRTLVRGESALTLALHQDLWAAVFLLPFAFTARQVPTADEWGLLLLLGVVFTAGAHALFIRGLRGVSAGRASVITALEPVYGVILAWQLLGERPELRTLAGGAIVLGAALWVGSSTDDPGAEGASGSIP